jgi:hypothetical protein
MMDVPTRLRHGLIGPQAKRPSTSRLGTTLSGCLVKTKIQGESKPEAYPLGYVEDFDELRTKLADFFSILLGVCGGSRQSCFLRQAQHEVHGLNGLACGSLHQIIQRGYGNDRS